MRIQVTVLAMAASGCAGKHSGAYEVAGGTNASDVSSLVTEADALWEQRGDASKLQAALSKYEAAYEVAPTDRHVAGQLVRGYYFLGDAHESEKEAKLAAWDKSVGWGTRCLAINDELARLVNEGEKEEDAAQVATKEDVPCLYWTSSALGKWAKMSGLAKLLKNVGTVKAYMTRVSELDPSYYFHGPDRYWGAYYAALPRFAGRDLDQSKSHLEKAIAGSPDFPGSQVILAEFWAVTSQDREVFKSSLETVVGMDPSALPEVEPEFVAEQQKAQALLNQIDDMFAE